MRTYVIAVALLSVLVGTPDVAHAAVGCTLDNPQDDLARFFPGFTDFSVQYLSFAVQDPESHQVLERRLGGTLDPVYETPDVPYALYTVNRDGVRLGYTFGVNQRGTFSNIQVVAIVDAHRALKQVYIQKLRSPDHALLQGEAFTASLARVPLGDYPGLEACFARGRCDDAPVADPTEGRQVEDYRAILRGLAKLHHVAELLLRPGDVPTARDARARAEHVALLWVPEQGFRPLDRPQKVSTGEAETHMVGPDALVAALPGRDRFTLYPISLLTAHPVLQDQLDGRELTIAWSGPSHTLSVLQSDGPTPLRFSNTMSLLFGHLTILERQSRAEWSPILGQVVQGAPSDAAVTHVAGAIVLPWRTARTLFPHAQVAVTTDPYSRHKDFYEAHRARFDRPGATTRVLVLAHEGEWRALGAAALSVEPFVMTRVGDTAVMVVTDDGARAAYRPSADGLALHFDPLVRDPETGAALVEDRETWSVWEAATGRAVDGPLAGARLPPVVFHEMPRTTYAALFPSRQ